MRTVVIQPPAEIVSIEEARRHLLDLPAEDEAYVTGLIAAATTWLDGPSGWLGRCLGVQKIEVSGSDPECCARLPYGNVLEIDGISYLDEAEVSQEIDPSLYLLCASGVWWRPGFSFPIVASVPDPIKIRYWAGYGERSSNDATQWVSTVPQAIKVAILMLVGQWYQQRQSVVIGATVETLPFAVDALLSPFQVYR